MSTFVFSKYIWSFFNDIAIELLGAKQRMAQIHTQWLIVFNDDNIIGISPVFVLKKKIIFLSKKDRWKSI